MAHMIPKEMREFNPKSREDVIFKALRKGLNDDYWVFHSFNVNQTSRDVFYEKEVDFLVYHRDKGILCIEAKNGHGIFYRDGEWRYTSGLPMPHNGPFKQAQLERITICHLLSRRGDEAALLQGGTRFRDIASRCKVVWGVWFHGMSRAEINALDLPADAPRDRILAQDDLSHPNLQPAIDRLFDVELPNGIETALDDEDHHWLVTHVLAPQIPGLCPAARTAANFNDLIYQQLIDEQARVLDFLEGQKSAVINGMAGTGKTFVALERARRCAARGEKILYLCFNMALRRHLETTFAAANPALASQIDFRTLDDFVAMLGQPLPPDLKSRPKPDILALQRARYNAAAETLADQIGHFRYTQVIVDEGQDCSISFIEDSGIMETLREVVTMQENGIGDRSAFFMFYDAYQLVSLRAGENADLPRVIRDSDCKLTLYKNCRNTNAIATSAARGILAHGQSPEMARGAIPGTSPEIHFFDTATSDDVLTAAVSHTVAELRKSYRPEDIVLISCAPEGEGHSRLEHSLKVNADTDDRRFNQVYPFTTYRKFKGLDAAAIVLVDVGRDAFAGNHEALPFYEGASRARQKLVVFAEMDESDCAFVLDAFAAANRYKVKPSTLSARQRLADFLQMANA